MFNLDPINSPQKLALITGASGGLGKAFAVECASRGWDLFLTDTSIATLNMLAAGLRNSYGVKVITKTCDLTDPTMRAALFDQIRTDNIRPNALINVAGIDYEGCFLDQSAQQIMRIIKLNIEATLAVTHAVLPYRNQRDIFYLINVSSLAAFYPMPVKATYAASKRFLVDFSLALQEELRDSGVRVTVLCPAGMPTNQECIKAIEAQGWAGHITTVDIGRVAHQTLEAAFAGQGLVIPGLMNRIIRLLGSLIPAALLARIINKRWTTAWHKRLTQEMKLSG